MVACKIEWITLPAPDLDAAMKFYESVFGFAISQYSDSFWVFKAGNLSGGLDKNLCVNGHGIGFSITVNCIEDAIAAILRNGGEVTKTGYSLGSGAGFCAQFKDPNGNRLELYSEQLTNETPNKGMQGSAGAPGGA